jgi:hypothetical protein
MQDEHLTTLHDAAAVVAAGVMVYTAMLLRKRVQYLSKPLVELVLFDQELKPPIAFGRTSNCVEAWFLSASLDLQQ